MPLLQHCDVAQHELAVPPLLVEQREQTLADRVAALLRPARRLHGDGVGGKRRIVKRGEVPANRRLPVEPKRESYVRGRSRRSVARHTLGFGHLVPRQRQGRPGPRIAEDRAVQPALGREREVPQRFDERPLAVDRLVKRALRQLPGALDGLAPQPLECVPGFAEPVRVGGSHLRQVGLATLQLGLDQWCDVHTINGETLDFAVDPHVDQARAAHHDVLEEDLSEVRPRQVDVVEVGVVEVNLMKRRPLQVHLLEAGVSEVLLMEIGHGADSNDATFAVLRDSHGALTNRSTCHPHDVAPHWEHRSINASAPVTWRLATRTPPPPRGASLMTVTTPSTRLRRSRTSARDVMAARVLAIGPVAAIATIGLAVLTGATAQSADVPPWVPWVALACLAVGLPHGAVDHLALLRPIRHRGLAAALYVACAATAAAVILLFPGPAFVAVVVMSVWHFGTGDVECLVDLGGDQRDTWAWSGLHVVAVGAVPLVLPLTSHAAASTLSLVQPGLPHLDGLASDGLRIATVLLALVVIARLLTLRRLRPASELLVLVVLGLLVTPLLAFGVYFAFWHALRHTARLAQDDTGALSSRALLRVVATGLPALVLTVIIVAVALLVVGGISGPGPWLWLTLAVVWGLTVPHMAVVSRFDAARRSASRPQLGPA